MNKITVIEALNRISEAIRNYIDAVIPPQAESEEVIEMLTEVLDNE